MSDFIRREDVVEALYQAIRTTLIGTFTDSMSLAIAMANNLPSVESERTGRWVLWNEPGCEYAKCTACGEMYNQDDLYIGGNDYPKFCPNCGAKME